MGVIQNSINQVLATSGVLAAMSPSLQARVKQRTEANRLAGQAKVLEKAQAEAQAAPDTEQSATLRKRIAQQQAAVSQAQFENQPTAESLKRALYADDYVENAVNIPANISPQQMAAARAEQSAANAIQAKADQRLSMKEFFDKITVAGVKGGGAGFSKETQKAMWKQLTPAQRRQMYEAEGGKK